MILGEIMKGLSVLALLLVALVGCKSVQNKKPNVIIVMTDDQGYGDFGFMGHKELKTINIDSLAKKSLIMKRFYVSPVCTPTRASLMTGRYNYRTGAIDTWIGRSIMRSQEKTMAEYFKTAGYKTGLFGKWHLGDCYPCRPQDQGFEYSITFKGGGLGQSADVRLPEEPYVYTNPVLFENGKVVKSKGYCTDVYFDHALDYITDKSSKDENFFCYIATNAPHGPFGDVPKELYEKYKGLVSNMKGSKRLKDNTARIYAMIENIDINVGRLVKKLKDLGELENTILLVFNDNGANGPRFNDGLRGMKTHVYEGGIRTPLVFHWPAKISGGKEFNQLSAHIDLLPTLLELCGVRAEFSNKLDGVSFAKELLAEKSKKHGRLLFFQTHRGNKPVRYHHFSVVSERWKLVNNDGFGSEKLIRKKFELYDLQNDPGEQIDLSAKEPIILKAILQKYEGWFDEMMTHSFDPVKIVIGNDSEKITRLTGQDRRDDQNWYMNAEEDGLYDIEVLLFKSKSKQQVSFTLRGKVYQKTAEIKSSRVIFKNVKISKGDFKLKVNATNRGPWQVIMRRIN